MKRLSVIITAYNVAPYLPQCIESVLNQSMREIEVILVDDGSTDGSGQICDQYAKKDTRVKVIHQKNQGRIKAKLHGLLESTCEYVTYVDGDDFIRPISYAQAIDGMDRHMDAVLFGLTRYHSEWDQRDEFHSCPEGIYDQDELRKSVWPVMIWNPAINVWGIDPSLWSKVMRRELILPCFQKVAFSRIEYGDDVAVIYPMLKSATMIELKNQSYYYHRQRKKGEIPDYIRDDAYFDKLYTLYRHLRTEFGDEPELMKQVEYVYMYSATLRKRIYEEYNSEHVQHMFPFDRVKKGERIVLYGAGMVGQAYMAQLHQLAYCEVVLWVDRDWQNCYQSNVSPVEAIQTVKYDKVVVAILNPESRVAIAKGLFDLGVSQNCVIV